MALTNWDNITNYMESVSSTDKAFSFAKPQESVKVTNKGNTNLIYTIGSQTGTLTPGQSVEVEETISAYTLRSTSGLQSFEVWAVEAGTEKEEPASDVMSLLTQNANQIGILNDKTFNIVTPEQFGANGADFGDDWQSIQNAIDSLTNGGIVLFTRDAYSISKPLKLNNRVYLMGRGREKTNISLANNSNCDMVQLTNTSVKEAGIFSLTLQGRKTFQIGTCHGINFINTGGSIADENFLLRDVMVFECAGKGVYLDAQVRGVTMENVLSKNNTLDNFHLDCTDSHFLNLTSVNGSETGIHVTGKNNRLVSCKAFYADKQGFLIDGGFNSLTSCEAQENGLEGIKIKDCEANTFEGFLSDTNGRLSWSPAVVFDNASKNIGTFTIAQRDTMNGHHTHAFEFTNNQSVMNDIKATLTVYSTNNANKIKYIKTTVPNISNRVTVNGSQVNLLDSLDFKMENRTSSGVADGFSFIADATLTRSIYIDKFNQTQVIDVTAGGATNKYVDFYKEITCRAGEKVAAFSLIMPDNNGQMWLDVTFYDGSNAVLSSAQSSVLTSTATNEYLPLRIDDTTAPANTAKVRFTIRIASASGSTTVKATIKEFKGTII